MQSKSLICAFEDRATADRPSIPWFSVGLVRSLPSNIYVIDRVDTSSMAVGRFLGSHQGHSLFLISIAGLYEYPLS